MQSARRFQFILGHQASVAFAFETIAQLHENNQRTQGLHYKSFRSLKCSRDDLKRSFYFLKDCIYLCEDEIIYGNTDLLSQLSELEMHVVLRYLDVEPDTVPVERRANFSFGQRFGLNQDLSIKQLTELALIDWRFKEHWEFWAEKYGLESSLGKFCREKARQS